MIKKSIYICCLGLLLICSSCFEIIEEVSLNDDGSGHVNLTLNLSRSKTKINSLRLLDSINDYKIPTEAEFKKEFEEMVSQVRATPGIIKVDYEMNFDEYIFSIACDFADVDALNTVITKFNRDKQVSKGLAQKHFSFDKERKTFRRNYPYDFEKEFNKVKLEDREVIENASMTTIYRFKTPIKSSKNKQAKISTSRQAIMLKVSAKDLINRQKSIKNQIILQ
ncbi:hypothetical protein MWU59_12780 [Flavobacteriaceae bacterium F08102]|nr:hypothetical protein [Flavobacteriaceae bacterium F08102]